MSACVKVSRNPMFSKPRARQVCPETLKICFGLEDDDCCGRCAKNIYELVAIANSAGSLTSELPMLPQNHR
jgi:hypothetical protein